MRMVKFKLSPSKKRYLKGKHAYDYIRAHLPVPHKFLKGLEPYFKEDFQAEMKNDEKEVTLTYRHLKNKNESQENKK
jgi:hypothetical protein